jgi:long-chain acyl-CoA synthetase
VENAIATHPDVAECAVFGIPDPKWGEAVHAVVVPKAGCTLNEETIRAHCRNLIAAYKCPKSVEVRAEPLPLSAVNKVSKISLKAKWWAGIDRAVS